jgi:hypothetical protein
MKGFSDEWRVLINFMSVGTVAVKINDDVG